jgi:NADH pyrophosphatase NudC (nudix superfamily)
MSLGLIILISVVFVIAFAWMLIKGTEDTEFCSQCGDELDGDEYTEGYCSVCNYYNNGGL